MRRISTKDIEALITQYHGNIAAIARALNVSRGTIYNRMKDDPKLRVAIDDAHEAMVDNMESKLYQAAMDGNLGAIIFWLKTQGKRRGWVERQEVTGAEGGALHHVYEFDFRSLSDEELEAEIVAEADRITRRAASSEVPMDPTPPDAEAS